MPGSHIDVSFVLTGTNYNSYKFSASNVIRFNLVTLAVMPLPLVQLELINQQKTSVDFNITTNTDGMVYYHLYIGESPGNVMTVEEVQVHIKNQIAILQSQKDFTQLVYLQDRDQRVGQVYYKTGRYTIRFTHMVPHMSYVFCTYVENSMKVITGPFCKVIQTQNWGDMKAMRVKFTRSITDF